MYQDKPIRRRQLISPWGVGSMINFPGDESLMTCGLDAWRFALEDCPSEMSVIEERLQKRLGVSHFRLPPEYRESGPGVGHPGLKVPFVRFPRWHYCPRCGAMEKLQIYSRPQRCKGPNYSRGMSCHTLSDRRRPRLIPVRFIAVCQNGHIEDFPFMEWVHREKAIEKDCQLRLRAGRSASALSGIIINCSCGAWKTMAGAFNENSLSNIMRCNGQRPWLGEIDDKARPCGKELRVVQRGASNVYFPYVISSIYLPKWGSSHKRKLIDVLEKNWEFLTETRVNRELNTAVFRAFAKKFRVDLDELLQAAQERLDAEKLVSDMTPEDEHPEETYRKAEYDAILAGLGGDNQDFSVKNKKSNEYGPVVRQYFRSIALIEKLRETRALVGFSRLLPDDGKNITERKADMALSKQINWLPAIVVRGEGIFFEFDAEKLDVWLQQPAVIRRTNILLQNYTVVWANRYHVERKLDIRPFSRFVLLHTFAHILVNQFSFECGYGSSALRERIYCDLESGQPMNGILIYTASGDSEGSLGGLVRQGNPGKLENIVTATLYSAQWCSSDPVCMESPGQGPDSCNLAACHSCCLVPETSCERGNRLLDRALIVGTLETPAAGYFSDFEAIL